MDAAVTLEIISLGKGLPAFVALKWSYSCVDQFMPGQGVSVCEGLSTSTALKGLLLTVCPHMGQQR